MPYKASIGRRRGSSVAGRVGANGLEVRGWFLSNYSYLTGSIASRTGQDLGRKTVRALRRADTRQLTDASVIRLAQQADRLPNRQVFALYLGMVGDLTAAKDLTHIRQNSSEVPDVQFERSLDRPASNARAC